MRSNKDTRPPHGAYLERGARPPGPPPPGDRFLTCTKTEEFSSFIATFRARDNILGRALVECTYKCTGGVGVQWWSAGAAEIEVKQISPPSDRSRFLAHLGCKGGCLEYKVQLLGGRG